MLNIKLQIRSMTRLDFVCLFLLLFLFNPGFAQKTKIGFPVLVLPAESFISNSGNVSVVGEEKKRVEVKANAEQAFLNYKINIPVAGRYSIRIYAKDVKGKSLTCWLEDYVDNKDGRTYDITGKMIFEKSTSSSSFIEKDGTPLAANLHYIKIHVANGELTLEKITFSLLKENKSSPSVFKQNMTGKDWSLVWSDEFNGQGLPDNSKWNYDLGNWGWGNNELQYYTVKRVQNARQEKGNLIVEARKNDNGHPWSSARLTTRGLQSFVYGKIEIRAKVASGLGSWSAGWLLGDDYVDELSWPYCGEIDVMENVGFEIDKSTGDGLTHASLHCGSYYFKLRNQPTAITEVPSMSNSFHTYTMEWYPDSILIGVDQQMYFKYKDKSSPLAWPFDKAQNLILDLAIGGGWGGAQGVDSTMTSQKLVVDYVRVYQLK
jgi:beta-glucanase (GH16 family)